MNEDLPVFQGPNQKSNAPDQDSRGSKDGSFVSLNDYRLKWVGTKKPVRLPMADDLNATSSSGVNWLLIANAMAPMMLAIRVNPSVAMIMW
jgi:hypothetical protein